MDGTLGETHGGEGPQSITLEDGIEATNYGQQTAALLGSGIADGNMQGSGNDTEDEADTLSMASPLGLQDEDWQPGPPALQDANWQPRSPATTESEDSLNKDEEENLEEPGTPSEDANSKELGTPSADANSKELGTASEDASSEEPGMPSEHADMSWEEAYNILVPDPVNASSQAFENALLTPAPRTPPFKDEVMALLDDAPPMPVRTDLQIEGTAKKTIASAKKTIAKAKKKDKKRIPTKLSPMEENSRSLGCQKKHGQPQRRPVQRATQSKVTTV